MQEYASCWGRCLEGKVLIAFPETAWSTRIFFLEYIRSGRAFTYDPPIALTGEAGKKEYPGCSEIYLDRLFPVYPVGPFVFQVMQVSYLMLQ